MFTLLIIIIVVVGIISACTPDKHNAREDAYALAKIPPFQVRARPMSTAAKFLNLAYDNSQLLTYFVYQNGTVTIWTGDGRNFTAPLNSMYVEFQKLQGMICYKIKVYGTKFSFYQTTNITSAEWDAISSVLCLAGSTYGRDIFSKSYKNMSRVSAAINAISKLY